MINDHRQCQGEGLYERGNQEISTGNAEKITSFKNGKEDEMYLEDEERCSRKYTREVT